MYRNVKLEKGLYNLSGKSFAQALEEADPSENYKDTPLANLDAYERQLKRFDIKVNGKDCDCISKFFTTTESAILFPEFVSRTIKQGMADSFLDKIVAVKTPCSSRIYRSFSITESSTAYGTTTAQGDSLPMTSITESSEAIALNKFGRIISTSYEALMNQSIEAYSITLRAVGRKLATAILGKAVYFLSLGASSISSSGSELTYSDIATLYGSFTDFKLDMILTSNTVAAKILSMSAMEDCTYDENGLTRFPFGAALLSSSQIPNEKIIGIDSRYALEMISNTDIFLETDKMIDKQLDRISVSIYVAFKRLINDAVKVLKLS